MSEEPNLTLIATDMQLLHRCAKGADGKFVLASFGENPGTGESIRARLEHFPVGSIAQMTARAIALASEPYRNVYVSFGTMRADLPAGKKGAESDVDKIIGLVVDFDAREDSDAHLWAERLPLPPTMVVETSSAPEPSFQCRFLFDQPVPVGEAKVLARALQKATGCDSCTADVSHVWRVAGSLNWPNKLKVTKYGRPSAPQLVKVIQPFDENRLVSPTALARALELSAASTPEPGSETPEQMFRAPRITLAELDQWGVPAELKTIIELGRNPAKPKRQDNSRSAWLFDAVRRLKRCGVPPEVILSIITDPAFKISDSVRDKGRRSIDYARRQIARADAEASDPVLESFNREHAVIENYGNRTIVVTFDSIGKISHRSFEDFKRSYDHRKVTVTRNGKKAIVGQGTAFLDNPNRRQFKSVIFLPGLEAEEGVLNLYRGPSVTPAPGNCEGYLNFVRDIICAGDEEISEWLLSSFAHLFQKPWEAPEVCIILRGRQGVGKNFFVESIGEIIADYFIVISNPKHLVSGFNRHLMDKLLVLADEAFFGDERRYAGILKNLVTQSQMAVEPKGVDVFMAKKYFRLVMASNEDFVVPADLDDRRMLVIDVSDARAKDHAYFEALRKEWEAGGREAFYDLMLKRDISTFNHRKRPETAGLVEQKIASLVGAERILYEMLSSGQAPFSLRQEVAEFVATEVLLEDYARRGLRTNARALADELAIIAMKTESTRQTVFGRQMRGFWLPSLRECRRTWARAKKLNVEWGDDDGEWINTQTPDSKWI